MSAREKKPIMPTEEQIQAVEHDGTFAAVDDNGRFVAIKADGELMEFIKISLAAMHNVAFYIARNKSPLIQNVLMHSTDKNGCTEVYRLSFAIDHQGVWRRLTTLDIPTVT